MDFFKNKLSFLLFIEFGLVISANMLIVIFIHLLVAGAHLNGADWKALRQLWYLQEISKTVLFDNNFYFLDTIVRPCPLASHMSLLSPSPSVLFANLINLLVSDPDSLAEVRVRHQHGHGRLRNQRHRQQLTLFSLYGRSRSSEICILKG